ncbi:McrB family protein [Psychrobacter sp. GP33]|uniref:McrB family protein n=1 Tax=Psychrobacter sp. GP33 TaxID=2758709 RepID=UPI0015FAF6BA|nr:AAA family ATPase [Psychrobacter sp. GP33]
MPNTLVNIIYTGVAGTGKTYQLLQIAKQYTDYLPTMDKAQLLAQLLHNLSWREVICLILLDFKHQQQELVKVPEILAHEFFIAKAEHNERNKNLSNTAWSVLQMHSSIDSQTVDYKNRSSQAYFDKDNSGAWFLLPECLPLLTDLSVQLLEYQQAQVAPIAITKPRFSMVSFHQAYGYEEFVEGIRPVLGANAQGQISYGIQDGAFLQLCQRAVNDPEQRYAMLIDELNRANVSRVFGELLSLIEPDKRSGQAHAMQVNLAYSGRPFSVPANVDIYATMNTQDHSLAPLDIAMRRRFRFIDCPPRPELLSTIKVLSDDNNSNENDPVNEIDLAQLLKGLNQRIIESLGIEAQLGHAFFCAVQDITQLQTVLIEQIIPQLVQVTGGQVSLLQYLFCDEQQPFTAQFIQDGQAVLSQSNSHNEQSNFTHQNAVSNLHQTLLNQGISHYKINADLLARTGAFANAATYQRLYG